MLACWGLQTGVSGHRYAEKPIGMFRETEDQ